jgi:hypothetical protein
VWKSFKYYWMLSVSNDFKADIKTSQVSIMNIVYYALCPAHLRAKNASMYLYRHMDECMLFLQLNTELH